MSIPENLLKADGIGSELDQWRPMGRSMNKKPSLAVRKSMGGRRNTVKKKREGITGLSAMLGADLNPRQSLGKGRNVRHKTMVDTGDGNRSKNMQEYLPDSIIICIKKWENESPNLNDESLQLPRSYQFNSVCLFIDLAGFTSLTENLNRMLGSIGLDARAAVEALVEKLNQLYSKMLNIILKYGGDATRFAGDAVEVVWPTFNKGGAYHQVTGRKVATAIRCALELSQSVSVLFDQVEFDAKKFAPYYQNINLQRGESIRERFKVRIGIGIGDVVILHVGGADDNVMKCRHEYICFGPAVSEAHDCEGMANPGETVVQTESLRSMRLSKAFVTHQIGDSAFSVVTHRVQRGRRPKDSVLSIRKRSSKAAIGQTSSMSSTRASIKGQAPPASGMNLSSNVERMLWRYVPIAAVPFIGESHHEEWLPEFRTVTTLFCNLGIDPDIQLLPMLNSPRPNLLDDFQEMFLGIQKCVFRFEGTINKFLVDKGSVIMIAFGLPPFAHVDDAKRGVLCAKAILKILDVFHAKLKQKSDDKPTVGVTTGTVLCGVIGSYAYYSKHRVSTKGDKTWSNMKQNNGDRKKHARREYSIMGDSVNVASRLMVLARSLTASLLVDRFTVASLRNEILFKGPSYHELKGKKHKVEVFQLAPSGERYTSRTELHKLRLNEVTRVLPEERKSSAEGFKRKKHGRTMRMGSITVFRSKSTTIAGVSNHSLTGSAKHQFYPAMQAELVAAKKAHCSEGDCGFNAQFVFLEGQVGVGKSHLLYQTFENEEDSSCKVFNAFGHAYKTSKEGNHLGTVKTLLKDMLSHVQNLLGLDPEEAIVKALESAAKLINNSGKPPQARLEIGNDQRKQYVSKLSQMSQDTKNLLKELLGTVFKASQSSLISTSTHLKSLFKEGMHVETIDCIIQNNKRANTPEAETAVFLAPVVQLTSALFAGLADIISHSDKPFICVIEDIHNMDLLCWTVLMEINLFYSATKALFVLSRTTLMLEEDELQIYKANDTVSAYSTNSIFGKFSSTKLQNQVTGVFHFREKFEANKASVRFLRLNCSSIFTKAILRGHFRVNAVDATLLRFLEQKTNGNPLFIIDAINMYDKLGLIMFENLENDMKSIKVQDLFAIYNAGTPSSVEGVCGAMIDRLSPIQQLLLKTCAACSVIERDRAVQSAKKTEPNLHKTRVIPNVFSKSLAITKFPIEEQVKLAESEFNELMEMGIIQKPVVVKMATRPAAGSDGSNQPPINKPPLVKRRATVLSSFRRRMFSATGEGGEENHDDEYCFGIPWMLDSVLHRMLSSQRKKLEVADYQAKDEEETETQKELRNVRSIRESIFKKSEFLGRADSFSKV